MKRILAVNPGGYPRVTEKAEGTRLQEAAEALRRGGTGEEDLRRVREETIRDVLQEQAKAGLDLVSDGQVRWHDPVSHVMMRFSGVAPGGPRRYFDTDLHYLRPRITGALELRGSLLAEEVKWARAVSMRPVTIALTGPLTLSRLSQIRGGPYENRDRLAEALVPFMAEEIDGLVKAGAGAIVVEEPFLKMEPEAWPLVRDALEILAARKGEIQLWLFPSFGDPALLEEKVQELAVDGLILDPSSPGGAVKRIVSGGGQLCVGLGLVDARVLKLESPADVAARAEELLGKSAASTIWLCPSGSLEALPRRRAWEKVAVLAQARDLLEGRLKRAFRRARAGAKRRFRKRRAAVRRRRSGRRGPASRIKRGRARS